MTGPANVPFQQVPALSGLRSTDRTGDVVQAVSTDDPLVLRQGTVSAVVNVHTYDVTLSGSGVTIPGVVSLCDHAPVAGDTVWLSVLPTGSYAINGIQGERVFQSGVITGINVSAVTAVTVALVFPIQYTVAASISVNAIVETPAFQRFYPYLNGAPTVSGCSFRVQQGENISTTIAGLKLHWQVDGV